VGDWDATGTDGDGVGDGDATGTDGVGDGDATGADSDGVGDGSASVGVGTGTSAQPSLGDGRGLGTGGVTATDGAGVATAGGAGGQDGDGVGDAANPAAGAPRHCVAPTPTTEPATAVPRTAEATVTRCCRWARRRTDARQPGGIAGARSAR
jgi:hypothetical protein